MLLTFTGFSSGPSVIHSGRAHLPLPGQVLLEMSEPTNEVSKGLPLWGERTLAGRGGQRASKRLYSQSCTLYKGENCEKHEGTEGRGGKRFVPPWVVFAILNWLLGAGVGHSYSYLNNIPRTATTHFLGTSLRIHAYHFTFYGLFPTHEIKTHFKDEETKTSRDYTFSPQSECWGEGGSQIRVL